MSASKRDFTNFNDFPGELDTGTGYHTLPQLYHTDELNRIRSWTIHVRLVKKDKPMISIDWNLLEEKQIPIKKEYYELGNKLPPYIAAQIWTETGIQNGKITRSIPTYIDDYKNEGRTNERNPFQSALIIARSQWLKRKEKGGNEMNSKVGNESLHKQVDISKATITLNVMYFPMLAKTYKDAEKYIQYPLFVQPKLDGIRCLIYLREKNNPESVIAYTRTKKPFPSIEYIKKVLYPYLNSLYDEKNNQSIYLDGELYKHGKKLQEISGDSRNEKESKNKNEYHIYDCFYPLDIDSDKYSFEKRLEQLKELFSSISKKDKLYIKEVPTEEAKDIKEANKIYANYIKKGYEGAMLRNKKGPYLANKDKTSSALRSNDLIKMKPTFTDEFEVSGFTEGTKGKDKGAIIWICKTANGEEFNVTPKDTTYDERYKLYKDCIDNFDKKYKGRMLTVEYQDLSKNNVPQRAKALTFRDYE
jgi:ATP-dependent DNA ligase